MSEFTMRVGGAEIIAVTDMNIIYPRPLPELFPEVPVEAWDAYRDDFADTFAGNHIRLEIGCYVVRSQGQTILIDTGYGPGPIEGEDGQLMDNLSANGVEANDVDVVFFSHLHPDHTGWNMILENGNVTNPTFPNARYIVHELDLEHFRKPEVEASMSFPFMYRDVEPLDNLGILDTIDEDTDLTPEVRAVHTPGHTPGHMSVVVADDGEEAIIQGDVFIHPAQVVEDDWNCIFDVDWPLTTETRRARCWTTPRTRAQRLSPAISPYPASAVSVAATASGTIRSGWTSCQRLAEGNRHDNRRGTSSTQQHRHRRDDAPGARSCSHSQLQD